MNDADLQGHQIAVGWGKAVKITPIPFQLVNKAAVPPVNTPKIAPTMDSTMMQQPLNMSMQPPPMMRAPPLVHGLPYPPPPTAFPPYLPPPPGISSYPQPFAAMNVVLPPLPPSMSMQATTSTSSTTNNTSDTNPISDIASASVSGSTGADSNAAQSIEDLIKKIKANQQQTNAGVISNITTNEQTSSITNSNLAMPLPPPPPAPPVIRTQATTIAYSDTTNSTSSHQKQTAPPPIFAKPPTSAPFYPPLPPPMLPPMFPEHSIYTNVNAHFNSGFNPAYSSIPNANSGVMLPPAMDEDPSITINVPENPIQKALIDTTALYVATDGEPFESVLSLLDVFLLLVDDVVVVDSGSREVVLQMLLLLIA